MELPEIITRLPEVELPIPSTTVRTSLLQSEHGQLVFFQILKDVELPPHSHKGQWGTVLEGLVELTTAGAAGVTTTEEGGESRGGGTVPAAMRRCVLSLTVAIDSCNRVEV